MSKKARLVIIGAGIVGTATAYHLAQMGWRDIVIVDKGQLPHNDGSTSHAPGGVVAASHSKIMSIYGQYTSHFLRSLHEQYPNPEQNMYNGVGGLELARTAARMQDLIRLQGTCKAFGVETHLLTPQETAERQPFLNVDALAGSLFVPDTAIIKGTLAIDTLLKATQALTNLEVIPFTYVTNIELKNGRVHAVLTDNPDVPRIETEMALLATNIWSSALSDTIGIPTPLMAFEHQYAITNPLASMRQFDRSEKDQEIIYPTARDVDRALYYRQHWDSFGIGSYYHKPLAVSPHDLTREQNAMHPFTPEDFVDARRMAEQMLPIAQGATMATKFNGMFAFSVDGMPIMGESKVSGFWTAVASWISHSAGVARSMAEWMTHGDTELDMRQVNINRFQPHATTQKYISTVTKKNYRELYDISHPRKPISEPRNIRLTPFYARHQAMGTSFTAFAGLELPNWFEENGRLVEKYAEQIPERSGWGAQAWSPIMAAEHLEVRRNVGMFDLTGLSIIAVSGTNALSFANRLCTNQIDVPVGEVVYTCWLTPKGGIKRDLAVVRLGADSFWMFVGEGTLPQDLDWVERQMPQDGSVVVRDISAEYSAIGVWGPNARNVVTKTTPNDLSNNAFPYYTAQWIEIGMARVLAMRISYAGELGWEFHVPIDSSLHVWDKLWAAGREFDMILGGMGAFDSLRLEKGYRLWGGDIHTEYNLYEAGMRWTAKLKKDGGFIGLDATRAAKKKGIKKKLCCLTLDDRNGVLFGGEAVFSGEQCLGYVTSANFGYSVGKYIAYAYLPSAFSAENTPLSIEYFGQRFTAKIAKEPLFDPKMTRMKS
ncbi:MAG: GcvT family protein [Candidatus Promineifilaceae bacterium]